jgi:hypothetical protein
MENKFDKTPMIQITGLWENQKKDGETYFKGYLGGANVLIYKNRYKTASNQPDYILYISEGKDKRKDENVDPSANDGAKKSAGEWKKFESKNVDDDIPF